MAWLRLTITSRPPCLDDLSDLLGKFGALSQSYSAGTSEPVFGDDSPVNKYWEHTLVSALFDPDIDIDILIACVRNKLGAENIIDYRIESVKDEVWDDIHKAAFKPLVYADRLCICPSWHSRPDGIPFLVELDPGLAFGTGSHPTTSLCLQWLADNNMNDKRVIDYGCGSGILGLAAARLGASEVIAVDIDPQALQATENNARQNGLESRIVTVYPDDDRLRQTDVLLANILLNPLIELVETFKSHLGEGGNIVLSGILAYQADTCMKTYSPWFEFDPPVFQDEWVMLSGVRNQVN